MQLKITTVLNVLKVTHFSFCFYRTSMLCLQEKTHMHTAACMHV